LSPQNKFCWTFLKGHLAESGILEKDWEDLFAEVKVLNFGLKLYFSAEKRGFA